MVSRLREYEDWLLLIGTILAGLNQVSTQDTRITLALIILSAIGKALLSIIATIRETEIQAPQTS
jgi:hypothetical protein